MRSISLHRQTSTALALIMIGAVVQADQVNFERRVVPAQVVKGRFIMQGSPQLTYPGVPAGSTVIEHAQSKPTTPGDKTRPRADAPRPGGVTSLLLREDPSVQAEFDATGANGERGLMAGVGDPDEPRSSAVTRPTSATPTPAVQTFALPEAPAPIEVREIPGSAPHATNPPAAKEVALPISRATNLPAKQAIVVPGDHAAPVRVANAAPTQHVPPREVRATAGGAAKSERPNAAAAPMRVAATEPPAARPDPAAPSAPVQFEFAVKEGDRLSIALRDFLKTQKKRMQWNTRTDFVIEHPYKVARNTLAETLTDVLREYRLSATIWQGNGVVEIFMQNGEINNEPTQ